MPVNTQEIKRCLECPARTAKGSCAIVDRHAGWGMGMPLQDCDACFEKGGMIGGEGERLRFFQASIDSLKKQLPRCKREVIFNIITHHSTPEERVSLWTPEVEQAFSKEVRWSQAQGSWEQASHFQRGSLKDFLKSLWSRAFEEPVSLGDFVQRQLSCAECPSRKVSGDGVHHFCDECGCGDSKRTWLDDPQGKGGYTKLHYPYLVCPRGRPGFSNVRLTVDGRPPQTR